VRPRACVTHDSRHAQSEWFVGKMPRKVTQAGDLPSLSANFPCVHPVRSNSLVNDLAGAWSRPMVTERLPKLKRAWDSAQP
jgi:hypothetical protein